MKVGCKVRRLIKACAISVLAFALSWIMIYDFTSLSYFAPMEKASDFISSDFYTLVAQSQSVKKFDDKIVVVSVDGLSRKGMAETFEAIGEGLPDVVAIDIMFEERGDDSDSELVESMSQLPKIIYPVAIMYDGSGTESSLYGYLDNAMPGVMNLDVNSQRNIVRTFKPVFNDDGILKESLSFSAVKNYKESPKDIKKTDESLDVDFTSTEFDCYSADEVIENPELVKDKLVFVGELQNITDVHSTPLDEYVPGIMIHAYSASTLLNGNYIRHVPDWLVWIASMILSVMFVYAQLSVGDTKPGNMLIRWMQAGILLVLIFVGSVLYLDNRISFDLSLPLLMITLGLLACDLWELVETAPTWVKWLSEKCRLLKEELKSHNKSINRIKKLCLNKKK